MIVESSRVETLFRKAARVREELRQYALAPDRTPVSIEDLQAVVCRMYTVRIDKRLVAVPSTFVQSMMQRFSDGRVLILLKAFLPPDEKRFAVTKELSHVILDEREDWSCDAKGTLADLLEFERIDIGANGNHQTSNRVVITENLASFLALDLLYRPELREADFAALQGTQAPSTAKLALEYELPQKMIETAHTPWFRKLCDQCAKDINS